MKFICLGYMDEKQWGTITQAEQAALMDECFATDFRFNKQNPGSEP